MSSGDPEDNEDEFENELKLDTLPPELFLHICSFLSSRFVIEVLGKVCRRFNEIVESETIWRTRIFSRWPKKYPLVKDPNLCWREACMEREDHYDLWKNSGENMKLFHLKEAHIGAVNIVQLLEEDKFCASGGRDGSIKLWNIKTLKETCPEKYSSSLVTTHNGAHNNAWIWSFAYDFEDKTLYSGAFDCNIRSWDIGDSSSSHSEIATLSSPILCLGYYNKTLAVGCYGRRVLLLDVRSKEHSMQHIQHKKPVICIATDERYIISGSEDKSVIVYDKIAGKTLTALKFQGFPLSMSYKNNQLLVGDLLGYIHVVDANHGKFELLQSYESGHKVKITGIQHSLGSIITCSTDETIRILEPNANPSAIAVLKCSAQVSKISAFKTTLVSANTDDSISVWQPNENVS